ncbi:MAG: hypothetical protein WCV62_06730 [Candidatus Peribacteraceae bacterium]|jgi:hypothetical protein
MKKQSVSKKQSKKPMTCEDAAKRYKAVASKHFTGSEDDEMWGDLNARAEVLEAFGDQMAPADIVASVTFMEKHWDLCTRG